MNYRVNHVKESPASRLAGRGPPAANVLSGCFGSGCRSQHLEQPVHGPAKLAGRCPGAVADDVGELAGGRHPEAVGGPGPDRPIAVQAHQRPDRDPGPAVQDLGHGLGLAAQAADDRGPDAAARPQPSAPPGRDHPDAVAGALANAIRTSTAQIDKASAEELKAGLKEASTGLAG
jgi:hypothetical protein